MKSQNERVLKYLQTHKRGITQYQALDKLGVMRLASRISDLREMGYPILKTTIEVKNRYDEVCRVAQYRLVER